MKLLRKILLRFVLLIILTAAVIGVISVNESYRATNDLTMSKVSDQLNLRSSLIEEKMESTVRMIDILGSDVDVIKALTYNKKDQGIIDSFTAVVEHNSDLITLVSLIDRNDIVLLSDSINAIEGIDLSAREYLIEAKASKDTSVSEIIISKADNSHAVAICKPIYNGDLYVGAIVSTIKFDLVSDLVDDAKVGENGYAFIIDIKGKDAGLVVDHPVEDMIMSTNLYDLEIPALSELADKMQTELAGEGYYTYKGDDKYVQFKRVADNWALAITANKDELNATSNKIMRVTILVGLAGLLLASLIGYAVINGAVVKPIKLLEASMAEAGKGDLTSSVTIKTRDEIENLADSFNKMLENQKRILSKVGDISQDLSASAEELTASAEEVNESANEVSENIQNMMTNIMSESSNMSEVQSQMDDLNTSIDESDEMVKQSLIACDESLVIATEGREGVGSSVTSISNISTATTEVIDAFEALTAHAKQVTGISEMISSIADQINLLALNASIEAARAGEAGRGFTVVAEEVRKLAEQTSQESDNISSVLSTISKLIVAANHSVLSSKVHVDQGEETIHALDGKFLNIIQAFERISNNISGLTEISASQVHISDDIMSAIAQMSISSDHNSAMAQEISASAEEQAAITESLSNASEETSGMAEELNSLMNQFKI